MSPKHDAGQSTYYGPKPQHMKCPSCQTDITTRVQPKPTAGTHVIACILCFLGCWVCSCLPYILDSCQNLDHYCPVCEAYLGSYGN